MGVNRGEFYWLGLGKRAKGRVPAKTVSGQAPGGRGGKGQACRQASWLGWKMMFSWQADGRALTQHLTHA